MNEYKDDMWDRVSYKLGNQAGNQTETDSGMRFIR